jgi:WD40 repeat protein
MRSKAKFFLLLIPLVVLTCSLASAFSWRPRTLEQHRKPIVSVAFSPDGKTLATGGADDKVRLWNVASRRIENTFILPLPGQATGVAFSPDGRLLAASIGGFAREKGETRLWNLKTGAQKSLWSRAHTMDDVEFSADSKIIAVSGGDYVTLSDVASGRMLKMMSAGEMSGFSDIALSPNAGMVIGVVAGDSVYWWDMASRPYNGNFFSPANKRSFHGLSVAFVPNSKNIAMSCGNGEVKIYDGNSKKLLRTFKAGSREIHAVAFSVDGKLLCAGSATGEVHIWQVKTGKLLRVLKGHLKGVTSVAFSPRTDTLASGSADGTTKLWRLK